MNSEKEIQAHRISVADGIAALSNKLVGDDFLKGPLQEIICDHVDLPSEVKPFIKGVRLGAAYAITLILTGKLDLTLLEKEETMREIKFRAWDTMGKGFINGFNMMGFSTGHGAPANQLQRYSKYWQEPDGYILEQFTGLKDKNSKEGFDCDIVSFGKTRPKYQIKWSISNAEFYLESIDEQKEVLHISNLLVGEIIGNIHDNPELKNQGSESARQGVGPADSDKQ